MLLAKALLPAPEFVPLLVRNWHGHVFLDEAIPEDFDELEAFGAGQFLNASMRRAPTSIPLGLFGFPFHAAVFRFPLR